MGFPISFQAYILPHTLNCMCVSVCITEIWFRYWQSKPRSSFRIGFSAVTFFAYTETFLNFFFLNLFVSTNALIKFLFRKTVMLVQIYQFVSYQLPGLKKSLVFQTSSFVFEKQIDIFLPSDKFYNFYDGAGSVLDSYHFIHPWLVIIYSNLF